MADRTESHLPADYVPRIHRADVLEVSPLDAGMIRVRFGGDDLTDYPTTGIGDEYVRMFFPSAPGTTVQLPRITSLRGWEYDDDVEPAPMRVYTIRRHAKGEVVVDFVVHEGGVAAAWAAQASVGQSVGINPPCELYDRPEALRRQILVADEPGLPAALRIAELTAETVETVIVAEVRADAYRLFADVEGVSYVWLDGSGNGYAESGILAELRTLAPGADTYVWVSTEGKLNRAVRRYLRHEQGLPGSNYKCVAYWQERAEAWRERYESLGSEFAAKIRAVRTSDRDDEDIDDEVESLYRAAGL